MLNETFSNRRKQRHICIMNEIKYKRIKLKIHMLKEINQKNDIQLSKVSSNSSIEDACKSEIVRFDVSEILLYVESKLSVF